MPADVSVEISNADVAVEVTQSPVSVVEVIVPDTDLQLTQLRLSDALSSSPEDPNGIFNAGGFIEDAAGWEVEIETGAPVDGTREGAWFRFPMPTGWRGDGTQCIVATLTPVTVPAASSEWWIALGWADNDALAANTPNMISAGWRAAFALSTAGLPCIMHETSSSVPSPPAGWGGTPLALQTRLLPYGDDADGVLGTSTSMGRSSASAAYIGRAGFNEVSPGVPPRRLVLGFGVNAINTGSPTTGKFKVEIGVRDLEVAGSLP